jgi:hypothetical protein
MSMTRSTRAITQRRRSMQGDAADPDGLNERVIGPTDPAALDGAIERTARAAVLIDTSEMADFLQTHLGQKLTAYIAGNKDLKTVSQWAKGRAEPSAIARERLRAAYHATALLAHVYGDRAAQAWFFGANHALDDHAPAAVLREAETPGEMAKIAPLAIAFVRVAS